LVGDPKGRMFTARFVFDSKIAPDLGRQLLLIRSSTCHTSGFWKTQSMVQKECNIHIVFLNIYHNDELLSYLLMYTSAIFFQHPSTQIYLIYSVLSMKSGQKLEYCCVALYFTWPRSYLPRKRTGNLVVLVDKFCVIYGIDYGARP
jgi:hypothetical protein